MFDLVRDVNAAIDAGTDRAQPMRAVVRDAFDEFDRVLGVIGAAPGRRRAAAGAGRRDRAADRGAQGRAAAPRLRRRRPHPRRSLADARHPARRQPGGHALEEEMSRCDRSRHQDRAARVRRRRRIIERDAQRRLAVLHARLSARHGARARARSVEDVDGNVFLDCAAGIAVNVDRPLASRRRRRRSSSRRSKFLHMSGTDFYYEPQVRLAEELSRDRADARAASVVLRQLRHRGDRSGDQAGALLHEAARTSSRSSARSTAARWDRCR